MITVELRYIGESVGLVKSEIKTGVFVFSTSQSHESIQSMVVNLCSKLHWHPLVWHRVEVERPQAVYSKALNALIS